MTVSAFAMRVLDVGPIALDRQRDAWKDRVTRASGAERAAGVAFAADY
jgi:hypothetical protein